jgi:class 3 adenylate cyclase
VAGKPWDLLLFGPYSAAVHSVYAQIHLYVGNRLVHSGELTMPTEFGRQSDDDSGGIYTPQLRNGSVRIAIAQKQLTDMSRQLLMLIPLPENRIRVENRGKQIIYIANQDALRPAQQREIPIPADLTVFDRRIQIVPPQALPKPTETVLLSMNDPVAPPGAPRDSISIPLSSNLPLAEKLSAPEREQLVRWLGGVTSVLQSAIGSPDFSERAAKEMVELIGLDSGRVLDLTSEGGWNIVAAYERDAPANRQQAWVPVRDLLRRVMIEKKTCWTTPLDLAADTSSRVGLMAAVAAPILDRKGKVIGALYGDRRKKHTVSGELIGQLEATLVETLARGVAAGKARLEQERAATSMQARFEQFFTPELSRQLASNPDLLTRRDTEVSVLFCDIRRFSAISEDRGPEITMQWLSDVMSSMADCAAIYDGSLIDYIGDELMVMWGAPADQPDHATRAAHAAIKMADRCAELDLKWRERLGHPTNIGIGINTGIAHVGNVGFERKFRYAPFGNTVNLASRVQGSTKYLGTTVIATEATFKQLKTKMLSRRLCSVRVVNIEQPVMLYELCNENDAAADQLCERYEAALSYYEKQELPSAIRILSEILRGRPDDGPTLLLLSRGVEALRHPDSTFNPVFDLPGK